MDMKLLELEDIDVALPSLLAETIPLDTDDAIRAVEFIKPKLAIPMHHNNFSQPIKADPKDFEKRRIKVKRQDYGDRRKYRNASFLTQRLWLESFLYCYLQHNTLYNIKP